MSNKYLAILICLAVCLGVGLGWFVFGTASHQTVPEASNSISNQQDDNALSKNRDHIIEKAVLSRIERRLNNLENQNQQNSNVFKDKTDKSPTNTEERYENETAQRDQERVLFEKIMKQEDVDPTWSAEFESKIVGLFEADRFPGTQLKSALCRTSVCEVELGHENETVQNLFVDTFPFETPNVAEGWYEKVGDKEKGLTTKFFLVREGHSVLKSPEKHGFRDP